MLILAFDCCLRGISVALLDGDSVVATHAEAMDAGQAERLLPAIEALLADAGVGFDRLHRIACTCGPGGFTSVRVGISAARGLALALAIPAVGISTLEALAATMATRSAAPLDGTIACVIPAGKGGVYWQTFDALGQPLDAARVVDGDRIAAQPLAGVAAIVGPAAADVAALLAHNCTAKIVADLQPDAVVIAQSAKHLTPDAQLRPIYLRAADARPQIGKALARA